MTVASFARALLWFTGLVFAAIGVGFLAVPVRWARTLEILLPSPLARIDLRATYGGFDLAFGIFLVVCAVQAGWLRPGLAAAGLALLGFAAGRVAGMALEGAAPRMMVGLLALEVALAALSWWAYVRLAPTAAGPS